MKGQKFGRLTVIKQDGHFPEGKKKRIAWLCKCSCGKELKGIPREIPGKIAKLSKTQRRPSRPYGGVLCSQCMRKTIIASQA